MKFEIVSGATTPAIKLNVAQQQSKTKKQILSLVDLDTATINWYGDNDVVQTRTMSVIDAENGIIEYRWVPSDTATPGLFNMYFKLEFNDGTIAIVTEKYLEEDKLYIKSFGPNSC